MKKLFFDIETIPCDDKVKEIYIEYRRKGMSDEMAQEKLEDIYLESSFDGTFGRICCIGYIKEDGVLMKGVLKGDEKEMLKEFWTIARDAQLFIGHNVYDFDLPFVYQRSIINGVKPRQDISFARYRRSPIFDTMREWIIWNMDKYKNRSLDILAKVMGYPTSKDEMNGGLVWQYFKEGRIDEICKYCMKDVELTRKIYYRMIVEDAPY